MEHFLPVYACPEFFCPGLQVVGVSVKQFQDHAGRVVFVCKSVRLVRIHMHGKGIGRADPDYHVGKDQGTLLACGDDKDDILVFSVSPERVDRCHMDMAFGHNDSLVQFYFPLWPDQGAAGSSFQIS